MTLYFKSTSKDYNLKNTITSLNNKDNSVSNKKKLNECNLINPLSSYDSAKKSFINTVHGANLERAKRKEVNHIEIDLKDSERIY